MFRFALLLLMSPAVSLQAVAAVKVNNLGGNQSLSNVELIDDFEQNRLKMYDQSHLHMESINQ